jgi:predicted secreted acid phosphatase
METYYQNADGKRYIKKILESGQCWWSVERSPGEFYVIGGKPREQLTLIKQECYVFDLDGTLFDNSAREHLIPDDPSRTENWTEWNKACHLDTVIEHVAIIARAIAKTDMEIRYVTSRCEDGIGETLDALMSAGLPIGYVHMRKINDNRCHTLVKLDEFNEISKTHDIIGAFDDQDDNVNVLTDAGYKVVKV